MVIMEFLTVDACYCFSAAAQAELFASSTRCPCGCYELGDVEKLLLLLLNPLRDGSVYSFCSFTPASALGIPPLSLPGKFPRIPRRSRESGEWKALEVQDTEPN